MFAPDPNVMTEKPRSWRAHIITRPTAIYIFSYGIAFFAFLACFWMKLLYNNEGMPHLDKHELGMFFSVFVFLQLWNLPNTRYFDTRRSFIGDIAKWAKGKMSRSHIFSMSFGMIMLVILFGQMLIVELFGEAFGVGVLTIKDWAIALSATSPVFIVPEIIRWIRNR